MIGLAEAIGSDAISGLGILTQFGAAGLIGWMWLVERRSAAQREREMSEAHARIMQDSKRLDVLLTALEQNARALSALESGQRRVIRVVETMCSSGVSSGGDDGGACRDCR